MVPRSKETVFGKDFRIQVVAVAVTLEYTFALHQDFAVFANFHLQVRKRLTYAPWTGLSRSIHANDRGTFRKSVTFAHIKADIQEETANGLV